MLIGEYQHSLDTKGRVNFPAKLREDLGESFILSKGLGDECLFVYSNEEWDKLTQKLNNLPLSKARALQRFLFAGATQVQPDKPGENSHPPKSAPVRKAAEGPCHRGRFQPRGNLGSGEVGTDVRRGHLRDDCPDDGRA